MFDSKLTFVAAAAIGLLAVGSAYAQAEGAQEARKCLVTVDRSQSAGTYDVTRQELENGDCICYLYTGQAADQSTTLENRVRALQDSRECRDALAVAVVGAYSSSAAAGAVGAGGAIAGSNSFFGLGLLPLLAGSGAAAAAVAASSGNDSAGG